VSRGVPPQWRQTARVDGIGWHEGSPAGSFSDEERAELIAASVVPPKWWACCSTRSMYCWCRTSLASSRDEMNVVEHGKRESASAGVLHRPRICVRVAKNAGRLQTDGR
jgi:hypothetical protein